MAGVFVAVVGPSGAGKDSLIAGAKGRLAADRRFVFVRRTVTRSEGGNEDHDRVDEAGFMARRAAGAFALSWGAHGLHYGIPVSAFEAIAEGRIAVANLSRGALVDARATFARLRVVSVTAPPEILAARLARRGRESEEEVARRLARRPARLPSGPDVVEIDNGGDLDVAVDAFVTLLVRFASSGQ